MSDTNLETEQMFGDWGGSRISYYQGLIQDVVRVIALTGKGPELTKEQSDWLSVQHDFKELTEAELLEKLNFYARALTAAINIPFDPPLGIPKY